jgi:hypothetical protein
MSCQGFQDQGARKQFYDPDKRDTPKVVFSPSVVWTVVGEIETGEAAGKAQGGRLKASCQF